MKNESQLPSHAKRLQMLSDRYFFYSQLGKEHDEVITNLENESFIPADTIHALIETQYEYLAQLKNEGANAELFAQKWPSFNWNKDELLKHWL